MSETGVVILVLYGYVGVVCLAGVAVEEVRDRWGRVPVIDPMWAVMKAGFEWCVRLPGRVVRWLRPSDTPSGLGDA